MQPAQLSIENLFFTKIHLDAFPSVERQTEWKVDSQLEVLRHKEDSRRWVVDLTVSLKGDAPDAPYSGEFRVIGAFAVASGVSEEVMTKLVNVNGPTMLYSAVREMVAMLTGRAPHGPILLPSVSFVDRGQRITPKGAEQMDDTRKEEHAVIVT